MADDVIDEPPIDPIGQDNVDPSLVGENEDENTQEPENTSPEAQELDGEEPTCKICRIGSYEDNPLYYPCKCSVRALFEALF